MSCAKIGFLIVHCSDTKKHLDYITTSVKI